jgi:lysophospholipase L1-like esterase
VHHGPLVTVTVLGDSVADSLGKGLAPVDEPLGARVINRGIVGCGVAATPRYRLRGQVYELADVCRDWATTWAADIARDRPKVALLVLGRHEVWDGELNGKWTSIGHADFDAYLAAQLDQAIRVAAGGGAVVALATSPYFHGREAPDGSRYPENDPARVDRFNQLLRAAVARSHTPAFAVELGRRACPDGRYTSTVDGVRIRDDGVHFSAAGARWLAPWLLPQIVDRTN